MAQGVEVATLAKGTPGFSGAELRNLVNEAALLAAQQDAEAIDGSMLDAAIDKIRMGAERKSVIMSFSIVAPACSCRALSSMCLKCIWIASCAFSYALAREGRQNHNVTREGNYK